MALVSVIIPNWNGEHLLPVCLDSLRRQTFDDVEVIVSDDASADSSRDLLATAYPEVLVVRSPVNRGFSKTANAGIRAARGELILLLNNDTELDPRCIEQLVRAMQADERLGICAPKMVYYDDPSLINSAGHACRPDGVVVDIGRGLPDGEWFQRPREVLGACAGAALYRRTMLEQAGLLDPDFSFSFEDADLDWRAQWAGWRARYVPDAVVKHREGVSRDITSRRAVFLGLRNLAHVWAKDWPLRTLLRRAPALWRGWRSAAVSLTLRGHGTTVAAATAAALIGIPRMLSRRRRIPRRRTVGLERFEELLALGARHARRPPVD